MFLLNAIINPSGEIEDISVDINYVIAMVVVYICFWIAVFLIGLAVYLHRKNKDKKMIHDIQEKIKNENKDKII